MEDVSDRISDLVWRTSVGRLLGWIVGAWVDGGRAPGEGPEVAEDEDDDEERDGRVDDRYAAEEVAHARHGREDGLEEGQGGLDGAKGSSVVARDADHLREPLACPYCVLVVETRRVDRRGVVHLLALLEELAPVLVDVRSHRLLEVDVVRFLSLEARTLDDT